MTYVSGDYHLSSNKYYQQKEEVMKRSLAILRYVAGMLLVYALLTGCAFKAKPQACTNCVHSADAAAQLALFKAQEANANGTFGVGGAIIENSTGRVIVALSNRVLAKLQPAVQHKDGETYTYDPTAHGERQLVYWYYQNRVAMNLPEPSKLTIVTSLDPCAMCTGTLLASGFNVGVVALDDFAGINYNSKFDFPGLPAQFRTMLESRFGYYGIDAGRMYVGGKSVLYSDSTVSQETYQNSLSVFVKNVQKIRDNSQGSGSDPKDLTDPALLPDSSAIKTAFRARYPSAFTYKLANFRAPDTSLRDHLTKLMVNTPGAQNAVALIDPFGNLVMSAADTFASNPTATAFMNLVQDYSTIRYNLVNNPATTLETRNSLTHPKFGTFVFLYAPSPSDPLTLQILGAYGSTMEGAIPQTKPSNFQYYYQPRIGTSADLLSLISNLPPFYKEIVGIVPEQVQGF
jgi:cytosine deaminase